MKRLSLLLLLFSSTALFAQNFSFLPASARKEKKHEFTEYLNNFPENKRDSIFYAIIRLKDDGTPYTRPYADSIFKAKSKDASYYTIKSFRDTISNDFYEILHKRTDEEVKADNKYWNNYFKEDDKNRKKLRHSSVNDFVMTDIQGNQYTTESLRGKVIILDFWFTTCAPCIKEMPELNKIREEFGTDEVAYFGITFSEKEKVEKLLKNVKYDYTIVADSKELCDKFGIMFYPTTLVIDKKGKIVYTGEFMGMKEKPKDIRKLLKKLTSGKKKTITAGPIEKQD
ncbi:TlpA family protein disulfide reductase [Flavobacterium sp. RHBU_3]|uniref:TlpA family protein disulfide reductase n=1 Tax=Flavobacterium sp. RHBU_3 TaxID=3391184 RepID=UPI003984A538